MPPIFPHPLQVSGRIIRDFPVIKGGIIPPHFSLGGLRVCSTTDKLTEDYYGIQKLG
ncbi:MAG TPA: hypothetical protein VF345_04215 [Chthoniobacterales bacterium]